MVEIKGGLDGAGLKIGIVRCRFNEPIGQVELEACLGRLGELGVAGSDIAVVAVAGALEAPLTLQRLAATGWRRRRKSAPRRRAATARRSPWRWRASRARSTSCTGSE